MERLQVNRFKKKCPVISSKTDHMVRTTQKSSPTQLGSHQITLLCEAD